jgi:ubiquinone/menaquinone biosynthesis C-methylase UbiE
MKVTRGSGLFEVFLAKKRAKLANKLISEGQRNGRILDIGCGSYPYFLETTKFKEKYGIDPSLNIALIKNKDIILKKIKIDKKTLPFVNNYFDVITMLAVFEHIEHDELQFVLKEVYRVLRKNGIFIITTPAPWSDKLLHFMAKFGLISAEEIHEHKHNHPKSKIENILSQAGFAKNKIKNGFFELHMNMWFTVRK